jgi:hypothetical protein
MTRFVLLSVTGLLKWGALSDEGSSLWFTVFGEPRQRSYFWFHIPQLYSQSMGSIFVTSYDSQDYGGDILTRLNTGWPSIVEVEAKLRPTVSRPVCPSVRRPSGTDDQFFFLLGISSGQLQVCYFVAPFLTRERVCNFLYNCFCALPEQWFLGRSSAKLTAIFYCLIWDSQNLEGLVPVFISHTNRVAQLYPRHWVPFLSSLTTSRAAVEVF